MENEDIRTLVTFGRGEDVHMPAQYWVEENKDRPGDITTFLLFPAAKAGQLDTLEKFIRYGEKGIFVYTHMYMYIESLCHYFIYFIIFCDR